MAFTNYQNDQNKYSMVGSKQITYPSVESIEKLFDARKLCDVRQNLLPAIQQFIQSFYHDLDALIKTTMLGEAYLVIQNKSVDCSLEIMNCVSLICQINEDKKIMARLVTYNRQVIDNFLLNNFIDELPAILSNLMEVKYVPCNGVAEHVVLTKVNDRKNLLHKSCLIEKFGNNVVFRSRECKFILRYNPETKNSDLKTEKCEACLEFIEDFMLNIEKQLKVEPDFTILEPPTDVLKHTKEEFDLPFDIKVEENVVSTNTNLVASVSRATDVCDVGVDLNDGVAEADKVGADHNFADEALDEPGDDDAAAEDDRSPSDADGVDEADEEEEVVEDKSKMKRRRRAIVDGDNWTCIECNLTFDSRQTYRRHQRQKHATNKKGQDSWHCSDCNIQYEKFTLYRDHMKKLHPTKFGCDYCSARFPLKFMMKKHTNDYHNRKEQRFCKTCSKAFLAKLKEPRLQCRRCDKSNICYICGRGFQKYELARHILRHGEHKLKCEICGHKFHDVFKHKQHMTVHTGQKDFFCEHCGKTFARKESLVKHNMHHTGNYMARCHICLKGFVDKFRMEEHVRVHTGEKPFACKICSVAFAKKSNFVAHMRKVHKVNNVNS